MHISADSDSPFFSLEAVLRADVTLNGEPLTHCVECDTDAGWADIYVKDAAAGVRRVRRTGTVRVTMRPLSKLADVVFTRPAQSPLTHGDGNGTQG